MRELQWFELFSELRSDSQIYSIKILCELNTFALLGGGKRIKIKFKKRKSSKIIINSSFSLALRSHYNTTLHYITQHSRAEQSTAQRQSLMAYIRKIKSSGKLYKFFIMSNSSKLKINFTFGNIFSNSSFLTTEATTRFATSIISS